MEAVEQWQFKPGTKDGQPERVAQSAEVSFGIEDAGPWRVRQAAFAVAARPDEVYLKPVLTLYSSPDPAACPAAGGAAILKISVGKDGRPHGLKPERHGDPMSQAAAKAIESWRLRPALADGKPISANAVIELECVPSSPPVWPTSIYRVGNGVSSPVPIYKPEPKYSNEAQKAKIQGEVALSLIIDPSGHTTQVRVVKELGFGLDEKAMEMASLWRFKPSMLNGRPVNVRAQIAVNFRLL